MLSATNSAIVMLLAGLGVPILAALNAGLGQRIGSSVFAALILFFVALAVTAIVLVASGASASGLAAAPKHLFLGGVFIAFYVLSITWIAPTFGVGNAVFFVLLGQLISAAIIDHFGLFVSQPTPLSAVRALGIAVMGAGVFLTQIATRG